MRECSVCGLVRGDTEEQCSHCGNFVSCYIPSQEEIRAGCQRAQQDWSAADWQRRGAWATEEVGDILCRRHPRGRRVMRDSEKD